jgi:ribonuclease HI
MEPKQKKNKNSVMPHIDYDILWGFFDGASQGDPPRCGVGGFFFLNQSHYFHIHYALGRGTNTKEEFSILWTLLLFSLKKGITKIQVMGDSKTVID